jgi:hemin uptake protein HemP
LFERGHGTLIKIHLLEGRTVKPAVVIRELSRLYSPGLRSGRTITWRTRYKNSMRIKDSQALLDPHGKLLSNALKVSQFNFVIEHNGEHAGRWARHSQRGYASLRIQNTQTVPMS